MTLVYTIGYEGTDIERFVATLKSIGVKQLADVRAVALFAKERLLEEGARCTTRGRGHSLPALCRSRRSKAGERSSPRSSMTGSVLSTART